ncbi:MAG: hypothetical protein WCJ22_01515 [Actinomycetes bacterium]|jgi:hypothetical protein
MISPFFLRRLLGAAAAGAVLAIVGALAHRQEWWFTFGSSLMRIPYGLVVAVLVIALWTWRLRNMWSATHAGVFVMAWSSVSLLISASRTDVIIAGDAFGYAYLVSGVLLSVVALAWPSKETFASLRQLRERRND